MYEFSKKEIRKKFKETEYGKKTNKWLYISLGFVGGVVLLALIVAILIVTKFVNVDAYLFMVLLSTFGYLLFISLILACYFDGKRDGAIEQFKRSIKK